MLFTIKSYSLHRIMCVPNNGLMVINEKFDGTNLTKKQTIWQFQQVLTRRLFTWSGFSIAAGLGMQVGDAFWRSVGAQAMGWGAIDALIAWFGQSSAQRKRSRLSDPLVQPVVTKETRSLQRLLWVNTALDVFYVMGGVLLTVTKGKTNRTWRGHGWGIIIQGGFLFLFDLYHVLRLPQKGLHR